MAQLIHHSTRHVLDKHLGVLPVNRCTLERFGDGKTTDTYIATLCDLGGEVIFRLSHTYGQFLTQLDRERGIVLVYRPVPDLGMLTPIVVWVQASYDPLLYVRPVRST